MNYCFVYTPKSDVISFLVENEAMFYVIAQEQETT